MRIDIIIPALNEATLIARSVQRAWKAQPNRVLVVDGGSRDQTVAIAREQGAEVFSSARSRARQQNQGAAKSRAEVLLFLHADSWLAPEGIEQIGFALENQAVFGGAFHQHIEAEGWAYCLLEHGNDARARYLRAPYGDQGLFLRRDVFQQLGGFPEVDLMEDLFLMRKLRKLAPPILLPGPLYVSARRWQRHGIVRQTAKNWMLLTAQRLGVRPKTLSRYYPPHRP